MNHRDRFEPAVSSYGFIGTYLVQTFAVRVPPPLVKLEHGRRVVGQVHELKKVRLEVDADQGQKMARLPVSGPENLIMPVGVFPLDAFFEIDAGEVGYESSLKMFPLTTKQLARLVDVEIFEKEPQRTVQNAPCHEDTEGRTPAPISHPIGRTLGQAPGQVRRNVHCRVESSRFASLARPWKFRPFAKVSQDRI